MWKWRTLDLSTTEVDKVKSRLLSISLAVVLGLSVGLAGCTGEEIPEVAKYTLTISSTEGGDAGCVPAVGCTCGEGTESGDGVTVPEECLCVEGTEVNIEAVADTDYRFAGWTGDVETVDDVDAANTTITMNDDCSITANFIRQYGLTLSSTSGGSVTAPGEGLHTYDAGEIVNIVAKAEKGYRFVNWVGSVGTVANVAAASTSITMNDDYSITGNFIAQYIVTIKSTDGGDVVTPGEGAFAYDAGAVVGLVAQAEKGYKFLSWTGDVDTVANVTAAATTISLEGDCMVTANFIQAHIYLDAIGPGLWGIGVWGQGVDATVTQEGIVVIIHSNPVDDPQVEPWPAFGAGASSTYLLEGDFDVRLAYELLTWPQGSGVRVGLGVSISDTPDKFVNVERVGFGRDDFPGEPREVYLAGFGYRIYGITGTDDLSGTLRILREEAIVSFYHGTSGDWHELYRAEWSSGGVSVQFSTWSHEKHFGGEEVRVLLRTVGFVEPAP